MIGWGLIDLQIGVVCNGTIDCSRIACNTEARAKIWESTNPELGAVSSWNWSAVSKLYRLVGSKIKSNSELKVGTRFLMPKANRLYQRGFKLGA
jgi:hypothetical protein